MDENEFWTLIDRSREGHADQEEALEKLLTGRPRDELEALDRIYREQLARAYRWDLWGAGYVINVEAEGLRYAVLEAYEATHGAEMGITGPAHEGDPVGEEWDEDEVYDRYPRLAEKFG